MAKDASDNVNYFLLIDNIHLADLAGIRKWDNLKAAFEGQQIWIKDFDYAQINALEVKSIPFKSVFYDKLGKLFPINSLLPNRSTPSLLWTPIARALPVKLPSFNHNYFGTAAQLALKLIPSNNEEEATAMMVGINQLGRYIQNAPEARLNRLTWTIINEDKVLLLGKPLLPISGTVFWNRKDFIIPAGFDFDLPLLSDLFNATLNPDNNDLVVWNTDDTCFLIKKTDLQPLSISSFRLSIRKISNPG